MIKNGILALIALLLVVIALLLLRNPKDSSGTIIEKQTAMIQEHLKHVGKLVVTEATFSQVYTYEDTKKYLFDLYASKKKAIVTVTAQVTVSFDLKQLETEIDEENKKVIIKHIPEEELRIYPKLDYYDIQSETLMLLM
jgi:hypothetical protein